MSCATRSNGFRVATDPSIARKSIAIWSYTPAGTDVNGKSIELLRADPAEMAHTPLWTAWATFVSAVSVVGIEAA